MKAFRLTPVVVFVLAFAVLGLATHVMHLYQHSSMRPLFIVVFPVIHFPLYVMEYMGLNPGMPWLSAGCVFWSLLITWTWHRRVNHKKVQIS